MEPSYIYEEKQVSIIIFFFFFQAEDGIRYHCVTGAQTCALPICLHFPAASAPLETLAAQARGEPESQNQERSRSRGYRRFLARPGPFLHEPDQAQRY